MASLISQYNIWDEYLTQISRLTSCFLRDDLGHHPHSVKLAARYAQNVEAMEKILFGNDEDLLEVFPSSELKDLKKLRHYYHPPAMGMCFPEHPRLEYISGAVAQRGQDFALLANTRIEVGEARAGGYFFREMVLEQEKDRDAFHPVDAFPGFVVDGRKVNLNRRASGCTPYGVSKTCDFEEVGRHRKPPFWLKAGKALALTCPVKERGPECSEPETLVQAKVGGPCDPEMQVVSGVY